MPQLVAVEPGSEKAGHHGGDAIAQSYQRQIDLALVAENAKHRHQRLDPEETHAPEHGVFQGQFPRRLAAGIEVIRHLPGEVAPEGEGEQSVQHRGAVLGPGQTPLKRNLLA